MHHAQLGDRSLFPHLKARAYLAHAAISAPSLPVEEAVGAIVHDYAERGFQAYPAWRDQRMHLREKIAKLIAARPEDIAFTLSTTRGISDIALCIPWKAGDRIISFQGEFPANITPFQRAAETFGLRMDLLPLDGFRVGDGGSGLMDLEKALREGVRLISVSAVQFQSGLRMPLAQMAELCHRYGAEISVDGIQACGAVPLDVKATGIDYLICGSHKWLMGLEGAGFVYIRPECLEHLRPTVAGWLSHDDGLAFLFQGAGHLRYDRPIRRRADFLEGGNLNAAGLSGLSASLELIQQIGVENIYTHVQSYHDALEQGLMDRGFTSVRSKHLPSRSCTLSVLPPADIELVNLQRGLTHHGIFCSMPDGHLRFAPHWPNALEEVPEVLAALDRCLTEL